LSFTVLVFLLSSTGRTSEPVTAEKGLLPETYGQVLYRHNEASPKQLYIIGISHQDTLTGANSPYTPRVEAEIYRIGAWLAREKGMELLLPEGFFAGAKGTILKNAGRVVSRSSHTEELRDLERMFAADKKSLNPEALLSEDLNLPLRQVEEQELYQTVHRGIRDLSDSTNLQQHFLIRSELDYHQDKRVGAMLQRIPEIIENARHQGLIRNQNGLFTIGLSHIPSILRFLQQGKVAISCPLFTSSKANFEECSEELNLVKEGFGVTVILPRTLADDQRLLKRNGIKIS
jgi:hypothetical protein